MKKIKDFERGDDVLIKITCHALYEKLIPELNQILSGWGKKSYYITNDSEKEPYISLKHDLLFRTHNLIISKDNKTATFKDTNQYSRHVQTIIDIRQFFENSNIVNDGYRIF